MFVSERRNEGIFGVEGGCDTETGVQAFEESAVKEEFA